MLCMNCGTSIDVPVSCGNRFCPICSKSRAAKIRRKVGELFRHVVPKDGESIKFLTLTVPNQDDIADSMDQLIKSFRRLRQRRYYQRALSAGLTFIEVTGKSGDWNVHLHAIILSRYIPVERLARDWSAVSPGQIVHIKRIPAAAAVKYLTAYALKSNQSEHNQRLISRALKGRRLFQPFGTWHAMMSAIVTPDPICAECKASAWTYNGDGRAVDRVFHSQKRIPYAYSGPARDD